MELDATQLYADKTTVEFGRALTAAQVKTLLQSARHYAESLGIPGLKTALEKTSSTRLLSWSAHKVLVLICPVGGVEFTTILTLQPFHETCVLGAYKLFPGEALFAVNQSAEVRRRIVIDRLRDIETLDHFFLADKAADWVAEYLHIAVKERLQPTES